MNDQEVSILTSTIPEYFGGRTQSLLKRARLFADFGINVRIITTNFNQDYPRILSSLITRQYINQKINFLNIFDYFKGTSFQENNVDEFIKKKFGDIYQYKVAKRDENLDYYRKNSEERIFAIRYVSHRIELIDVFESGKRPRYRYYVSSQGQVSKKRTYLQGTWQVEKDEILKNSFETVVTFKYKDNKKEQVYLHSSGGKVFKNEKDFFKYFFDKVLRPGERVINDARLLDKPLLNTKQDVKKIFQLHNTHLQNPQDYYSGIKKSYKSVLTSSKHIKIVTLTAAQKSVIVDELPEQEKKIVTIPHSTSYKKINGMKLQNHAVIVSRLDNNQKNIADGIAAFAIFHHKYPLYILDIYGEGESLNSLKNLTKSLCIDDKVVFHGYTDNPDEAYQSANFSIVSSNYEAFALNVLESIANGTQVVSYDVNFGPKEIIGNTAGFISVEHTPESLAECMYKAVENPRMKNDIVLRSSMYSDLIFVERWFRLLEIDNKHI